MKELLDPDVDIMSSVPNKKYLVLAAGKAIAIIVPVPVYEITTSLIGRKAAWSCWW